MTQKQQPILKDGYYSFEVGKTFKVLQLTDLHLGATVFSRKADRLARTAIEKIVEHSNPDLIILTGDCVFPIPIYSGTCNNLKQARLVSDIMSGFNIPWTLVFGNHDVESFAFFSKERLSKFYAEQKNCIFQRGEGNLSGEGNTIILLTDNGKNVMPLVLLDSNMYAGKSFFSGFDHIHTDQIEWYKKEVLRLSGDGELLPSAAYFHIPVTEFKEAWNRYCRGKTDVKYFMGQVGEANDYFGVPRVKDTFFSEMVNFGSCKAMFMGHDHLNNVSLEYDGIRLTYGLSIDFFAYRKIRRYITQRGGTVFSVHSDGSFEIEHVYLSDL